MSCDATYAQFCLLIGIDVWFASITSNPRLDKAPRNGFVYALLSLGFSSIDFLS